MRDFGGLPNILVTGGTGSFGRALCRFLLEENMVSRLCVLSRGEHAQAEMREELRDDGRLRFFVGDIRDQARLTRAMWGVEYVIHAAALKRVEVGRYNPEEMVKTNVLGALNVVEAARLCGVRKVVGLSTDKAFEPVSAYGASKAMMEHIFTAANDNSGPDAPNFCLTRYGNVWGSAGSILPRWLKLAEAGEVLPVTDPNCTRFMMSMAQAIELVMGAVVHGKPGSIAIPDLPAYRVGDLAEALGCEMRVIGLGKHEKLHESMRAGAPSDMAPRLSVNDLRTEIHYWREANG
jgi:UDP-N-acetylglucosamine 4,6-dehydratase/5-epimerase